MISHLILFLFFFSMVRPGCPVILLHLFSIFVQTGGIMHINIDRTCLSHPSQPYLLRVEKSQFNKLLLYALFFF